MPKPIETMSDKQVDQEIANFERYRTSKIKEHRDLVEKNSARLAELYSAKSKRTGFDFEKSLAAIKARAKDGKFLCYKDLADANGIEWSKARMIINSHLWDLVHFSHARYELMISSVIVNKPNLQSGKMEEETLKGFVTAAEKLGFAVGRNEEEHKKFLQDQQDKVFKKFAH